MQRLLWVDGKLAECIYHCAVDLAEVVDRNTDPGRGPRTDDPVCAGQHDLAIVLAPELLGESPAACATIARPADCDEALL